jgi:hypothetical protein
MAPRQPRATSGPKKRKHSTAERKAEAITTIRRLLKPAGSDEEFGRWVDQARQQSKRGAGQPAQWRDDRLLLPLEWRCRWASWPKEKLEKLGYRGAPIISGSMRTEVTRQFVEELWPLFKSAGSNTKEAVTKRLLRKLKESGFTELSAKELSAAAHRYAISPLTGRRASFRKRGSS